MEGFQPHPGAVPHDANPEADAGRLCAFLEAALYGEEGHAVRDFLAVEFIGHARDGDQGRDDFLASLAERSKRYPAAVWTIELLTTVGTFVVCHGTMLSAAPEAGAVRLRETTIARVVLGRMVECWHASSETLLLADASSTHPRGGNEGLGAR